MELTKIIQTEVTNCCRIYLYHHKGIVWGCCGRSALLLHHIYQNIPYKDRDVSGNGDILPVMIIDQMTLADLIERISPIERNEKEWYLQYQKIGDYIYCYSYFSASDFLYISTFTQRFTSLGE